MVQPLGRQFSSCFTKQNILLPYAIAITLLGMYLKELKTYVHTKTWMFIVTLFIIAKTWKQPRCPSVGEWIDKLQSIQTTEYYSVLIKKEKLSCYEKIWRNFKCILLGERNQSGDFPGGPMAKTKCSQCRESESEVSQLWPTLCNPMDCSLPYSSVHGIFQARILQWVTNSFPRGSSQPRDQTQVSCIAGRLLAI